jgi:hypothetical protein
MLNKSSGKLVSLDAIRAAFPSEGRPNVDELVNLPFPYDPALAQSYTDDEAESVRKLFAGKNWEELIGKLPNSMAVQGAFVFLLPAAARYYLPAFLVTVMADWKDSRAATDALMNRLQNPETRGKSPAPESVAKEIQAKWQAFVNGLTPAQVGLVGLFLDSLRGASEAFDLDVDSILIGYPPFAHKRPPSPHS